MFGSDFQNRINQLLSEVGNTTWIDLKSSYDFMYEAAKDFAKETRSCTDVQVIPTVANVGSYNLNPNFLEIITKDDHDRAIISYTNTAGDVDWLTWESFSDYMQSMSVSVAGTPSDFAVVDAPLPTRYTGTTTALGTEVGGESVLVDASATFINAYAGDYVINTSGTLGATLYTGVVLSPLTSTTVRTAIFDLTVRGGAYANWGSGDTYMIQPAPRYMLCLDPAPIVSGELITIGYVAKPKPVYSEYGIYDFATGYEESLIKYAAWLYKYRDSKQKMGDPLYVAYEREMRKGKNVHRKAVGGAGFRVNFLK